MPNMNLTHWILIVVVFFLVLWDICAGCRWGYDGTISRDILQASRANPIIPLATGIILGHLSCPGEAPMPAPSALLPSARSPSRSASSSGRWSSDSLRNSDFPLLPETTLDTMP